MDRSWMTANRMSDEYSKGVDDFIQFAQTHDVEKKGIYFCPCVKCANIKCQNAVGIRDHLIVSGILTDYKVWYWHGEQIDDTVPEHIETSTHSDDDHVEYLIQDVEHESLQNPPVYEQLRTDSETPLYPGCEQYWTRLTAVLELTNVKARNGWSNKSFTDLLQVLGRMFPDKHTLPSNHYEANKIMCPMGLNYQRIHACPNDCILYRNEYEDLDQCPNCGLSRYKIKTGMNNVEEGSNCRSPAKVLWYLPIIPRFKRLFANVEDAKNLTWHSHGRKSDSYLRHPADSLQWKNIDCLYPEFGRESGNLRLGLATDGMNPYGALSSTHSSWPVFIVIYNLPPSLCMKRKYVMMAMMISGPKQPGNDIDVYLSPLIEDLQLLWRDGVEVFDGHRRQNFVMRALLFCTINDFPAYGNLSGYSVKGHRACPICENGTSYTQLKHGRKTIYNRHRRFLRRDHPYRRFRKPFDGQQENDNAPDPLSGKQVYDRVKNIDTVFGKSKKKGTTQNIWKKKSIFFDLPYWERLDVRHCLDVMHIEKNVCDSLIGTLLNVKGKTKDGLHAREDMREMNIRPSLHPIRNGNRAYLPPAPHTLSKLEKTSLCRCLHGVKVPQGYSSNIKNLVNMQELKLVGLKSHDCHVLIQQLLPVAIRGILPDKVRHTITRLCAFFNDICSKVIDPKKLDDMENDAAIILSELEMHFPPSFFDIMVHLTIHLVREIRLCGPVYMRWMYPIERYMKILKGYTKNPYRPEASIVQRYVAEEGIEFCNEYLSQTESIGIPKSRHGDRVTGVGTLGLSIQTKLREDVYKAHLCILNNTDDVLPYLDDHKEQLKKKNPRKTEKWILNEHNKCFIEWFNGKVMHDAPACDTLKWLAVGPKLSVITWSGFDINKYSFYTQSQDEKSTVQNSGVTVRAEAVHFSSSKDKNPITASVNYFGVIKTRLNGRKIPVVVEPSGRARYPSSEFQSYLGTLARTRVDIRIDYWTDVSDTVKEMIWTDIQLSFDVPNNKEVKLRTFQSIGKKWRDYKSTLSNDILKHGLTDEKILADNDHIAANVWADFKASRMTDAWKAKRAKGQENAAKNLTPCTSSRGG